MKTILNQQIRKYLLQNPVDRSQPNPYTPAAKKFGVSEEVIRNAWRGLRHKGLVESNTFPNITKSAEAVRSYGETSDKAFIKEDSPNEVKSLEQLIEVCKIDTTQWEVDTWECKRYNSWIKKDGDIYNEPRYSISAKLVRITLDKNIRKQSEVLLAEIKDILSKEREPVELKEYTGTGGLLLELSAPDLHVGKLSWAEESGEDYDIQIACKRYKDAIYNLAGRAPLEDIERILLPVGNDMITIDSRKNTTTAGTPQDSDSRFRKMLTVVRDLLIEVINTLSDIAPVDVVIVSGNHDYDSMFTIGMVLEAFYSGDENVMIDNSATQRKYYQFYKNGILFTHGDEEKHQDLGLIFATEQPQMWADTYFREVQLGHFHKNKRVNFVSVDEHQGFQLQIIPSLSGTDVWHNTKGYNSLKQAKAFLYDKEEGKIAEFTYTIKK